MIAYGDLHRVVVKTVFQDSVFAMFGMFQVNIYNLYIPLIVTCNIILIKHIIYRFSGSCDYPLQRHTITTS